MDRVRKSLEKAFERSRALREAARKVRASARAMRAKARELKMETADLRTTSEEAVLYYHKKKPGKSSV